MLSPRSKTSWTCSQMSVWFVNAARQRSTGVVFRTSRTTRSHSVRSLSCSLCLQTTTSSTTSTNTTRFNIMARQSCWIHIINLIHPPTLNNMSSECSWCSWHRWIMLKMKPFDVKIIVKIEKSLSPCCWELKAIRSLIAPWFDMFFKRCASGST